MLKTCGGNLTSLCHGDNVMPLRNGWHGISLDRRWYSVIAESQILDHHGMQSSVVERCNRPEFSLTIDYHFDILQPRIVNEELNNRQKREEKRLTCHDPRLPQGEIRRRKAGAQVQGSEELRRHIC